VLLLAGASLLVQVLGHANAGGDLPAAASDRIRVVQYLLMLALFSGFALIGSWVAFGPGERQVSGSILFFSDTTNEFIGRGAFAFGAVLIWLCTIAVAIAGARKLRRKAG
jgi:hypothetical protein